MFLSRGLHTEQCAASSHCVDLSTTNTNNKTKKGRRQKKKKKKASATSADDEAAFSSTISSSNEEVKSMLRKGRSLSLMSGSSVEIFPDEVDLSLQARRWASRKEARPMLRRGRSLSLLSGSSIELFPDEVEMTTASHRRLSGVSSSFIRRRSVPGIVRSGPSMARSDPGIGAYGSVSTSTMATDSDRADFRRSRGKLNLMDYEKWEKDTTPQRRLSLGEKIHSRFKKWFSGSSKSSSSLKNRRNN